MLKVCCRCGKIHSRDYNCQPVVKVQKRYSQADKFRNTQLWRKKANSIKKRDYQMCRVCLLNLYNTIRQYNSENTSVHHIIPLSEDFGKRLDDDNLITLCRYHHELAENGAIPRSLLREIAASPICFNELK